MEPHDVRDALVRDEQYAPDADVVWAAVTAATAGRQLTRRRLVIGGLAAGVAAIATGTTLSRQLANHGAVAGPPTIPRSTAATADQPSTKPATTSASPPSAGQSATALTPTTTSPQPAPAASASVLARGRWTSLPAAPIPPRGDPVAVWTGTEMLIWGGVGGAESDTLLTDGAAYHPGSRRWRTLAPAPPGARARWDGVWTGTSLLLWGVAMDGKDTSPTGARYDPSTDRWQVLPDPPTGVSSATQVVWTGTKMVALAIPTGTDPQRIAAASYDPRTNTWSALPSIQSPTGHPVITMQVAAAGGTVYLWSRWQHSTTTTTKIGIEIDSTAGTDCFKLDDTTTWHPTSFTGGSGVNGSTPIWTGTTFVQPAATNWSGYHSEPVPLNLTGRLLNPTTESVADMTHGPVDDLSPRSIWTGAALICFDTTTYRSGGGHTHYAGEAAVWNPTTNAWTPLPGPGLASIARPAAVWTGTSLLMWGSFYQSKNVNGPTAPKQSAAGLEFSPPTSTAPTTRSTAQTSR